MKVKKRDGKIVEFDFNKIRKAIIAAYESVGYDYNTADKYPIEDFIIDIQNLIPQKFDVEEIIDVEDIQDLIEDEMIDAADNQVAKSFIRYRDKHKNIRDYVQKKIDYINKYKESGNTADATVDDNSNVCNKNVGILNSEAHKEENIEVSRGMIMSKLKELYPDFDNKQYIKDLESHIIYKHDESSFVGAIAPYCCSITMYPFLTNGLKGLGGKSAYPKNLDSFCGMYVNLIFAVSAQFAGAVATSEFLMYFDYFARKEWGDDYYSKVNTVITSDACFRKKTIQSQIHQYFQQVIYSINQPAAARGLQSAFVNFSYFDKPFFEGMFGDFYFPDGTQPKWESLQWLQKDFMMWFNDERLKVINTFPVESVTLLYKDSKFVDEDMFNFVCEEYARGHSFFTYISDSVDSLSSCCRLKNMIQTKEFNFTNGNIGVQTGSKSVITLNLNRIVQNFIRENYDNNPFPGTQLSDKAYPKLEKYIINILERVYKYHTAYNELLWDMYNADLLPVYSAGFINLNKQYLTIGINGLNQAAEFLGMKCTDNPDYQKFCQTIFSTIKEQNLAHKTKKLTFNTEQVPAESLAVKNYNWDKSQGYWTPDDTNLYASYIFKPNEDISILEKIRLHGRNYIGDYLDGGAAAHLNLDAHLSVEQYRKLLTYAAENGCQYLTFNIPNSECEDCGFITKHPIDKCPHCGSTNISLWDRVIGYLSKKKNWSEGRRKEKRVYSNGKEEIK